MGIAPETLKLVVWLSTKLWGESAGKRHEVIYEGEKESAVYEAKERESKDNLSYTPADGNFLTVSFS